MGCTCPLSRKTGRAEHDWLSRKVIETHLTKNDERDQNAQDEHDERQQINRVGQPRLMIATRIYQKCRHEFLWDGSRIGCRFRLRLDGPDLFEVRGLRSEMRLLSVK